MSGTRALVPRRVMCSDGLWFLVVVWQMARLDDDRRMLGFYGVESGMIIHVTDEVRMDLWVVGKTEFVLVSDWLM